MSSLDRLATAQQSGRTRVQKLSDDELRENRIVAPFLGTVDADVFRMLRTQVRRRLKIRNAKTLGICSPLPGAGKTSVALNLAVSMSMDANQTILLVEIDLRRPMLLKYLGLKVEKGLTDILRGDASVEECLVNPGFKRLVVLPAREAVMESSELIASPRMDALADELRDRYPDRIIIYDMPPILSSDDSLAFLHNVDACLIVVDEGGTTIPDLERMLSLVERDKVIGSVLNKAANASTNMYGYY